MAIRYDNKELPITIAFNHGDYSEDKVFKTIYPSNEYVRQASFIEIYENLITGIKFYGDNEDSFDEHASIEIQTSLYDTKDVQETKIVPMTQEPMIHWLYKRNVQEVFPWRMGTYLMKIHYRGESYTLVFFVKPLYLSVEQVNKVHEFLESKVEGIIYDLVYSNKSMSENNEEVLTNWYYDYARYMMNHKESILYFLYIFEKQPVSSLIGTNEVSTIQGRINRKSFQWDLTSKGLSKNSGSSTEQTYFYNRIKKINYNLKSNQWIKNVLLMWSTEINHVLEVISNNHLNVQKEINTLKQQQVEIEERRTYLNQKRDVAKSEKIDLFVKIKNLEKGIQNNMQIASQQDNWIIQLRSIYSRMIHLLNNSFLEEVDRGKSKPVLKSNSYYQINSLYENSKKIQKDNGDKQRYIKILKPFWQIYEYFCLFTVIDSLRKMGYKVTSGFEHSFVELYHQSMVPPNTLIRLESDNAVIDCWYDKYHGNIFTAQQNNELFYTTQEKKRPDIKLDLYEKQVDGSLLFRNCLIFDAKFRKLSNMHNNDYETTTYEQLTSYYSFFYLGKNRKSGRGNVVEQVICLYGSEKTEAIKKVVDPLLYIKLFPIIQEDNEVQIKGEKELLEEIETWLDDLTPVLQE